MSANEASQPADQETDVRLAVCMSGGGHRATLFGLGALTYLVDAGANAKVTSIASVSGGSLTNGFVGQTLDFRTADAAAFRQQAAGPLGSQLAKSGTLFAPLLTKIYLTLLFVGAAVVVAALFVTPGPSFVRVLAFLVGLLAWGWLVGQRGLVCARAFETTLFSPGGRATPLSAVKRSGLDHVICSTEMRAAEQVYFAGDFIYSYWLGHGVPANLGLARAVQASACFPGGFPPTRLATKQHNFAGVPTQPDGPPEPPAQMVMVDGGVYDNMGDQWARGFDGRVKRWHDLGKGRQAPNRLVVVNASARVPWTPFRRGLIPLIGEVVSLLRVNSVMYINTTNVRRQDIVSSYDPNHPEKASALPGALVQISQSPFGVADAFASGAGPVAERAQAVIALLGRANRDKWAQIARDNAKVATSLNKMGIDVSARLMYQGYVVTMCNLHVIFGPEFPLLDVSFEQFRELIA